MVGYGLFSFSAGYPIKTKIPFYLVEEFGADDKLLLVLLLLAYTHLLEALLSCRGGRWGGDLDSIHGTGRGAALASNPVVGLIESHRNDVLSHCLAVESCGLIAVEIAEMVTS